MLDDVELLEKGLLNDTPPPRPPEAALDFYPQLKLVLMFMCVFVSLYFDIRCLCFGSFSRL